jgi:tetrahydromethanopterin S-methyltransferase subunit G
MATKSQTIDERVSEVEGRVDTHEAVCAERYSGINARLKRLEGILIGTAGAIILLLLSLVLKVK